jgi:hypothetical protein
MPLFLTPPAIVYHIADAKPDIFLAKIGTLPGMPTPAVYRRATGGTFLKLNETYHVRVNIVPGGQVLGEGEAEAFDPEEIVIVLVITGHDN